MVKRVIYGYNAVEEMQAKNYAKQARSRSSNKINASHPLKVQRSDVILLDEETPPPSPPTFNIHKNKKRNKNEDNMMRSDTDMLSKLPDDILVYLLSFLDMKTAGRTSLLSKRWRYVWTRITRLDFRDHKYFNKSSSGDSLSCGPFCKWVNNVTTAHRSPHLDSMRIHFPLRQTHVVKDMVSGMELQLYIYIHQWIKFGLRKKVAKLELNLATATAHKHPERDWAGCLYMENPNLSHLKSNWKSPHLKSLHLEALCIDGPLVEKVLSNCPNLEQLIVKSCAFKSFSLVAAGKSSLFLWCNAFKNAKLISKISVSSPKLKHLEFSECNIKFFQISAPKLNALVFIPLTTIMPEVEYRSVPSLADATLVSSYCFHILHFSDFPSYTLKKLTLRWDEWGNIQPGFPILFEDKIIALISLIKACPLLHTFKLELNGKSWLRTDRGAGMDVENGIGHEHLKVIEIVGYDGSACADRIALCVAHPMHTPKLNKFILDPSSPKYFDNFCVTQVKCIIGRARVQAKLLANQISGRVYVDIL